MVALRPVGPNPVIRFLRRAFFTDFPSSPTRYVKPRNL
jgi:hypothetical protein